MPLYGPGAMMSRVRIMPSQAQSTGETVLRFLAAGVANTAVGYGIYLVAVIAGAAPQLALILQFVLGALWNYQLHARMVFAVEGWRRLPAYIGSYLLIYAANALALRLLLAQGVGPLVAQLVLLPFVVLASWLLIGRVMGFRHRGVRR
ncbi:GtrA-like protein [Paracoccus isoporae]|uniref:GtrA-like protein n=1 Tax=Paracoccus isoporae TaxID=591205 RepID=A0A1G6UJ92_9RHOB|nr:GtrA family protein [Paracoccus isoporae]SDD41500.1 GtrA-like protein [Paracoccus isoporae]